MNKSKPNTEYKIAVDSELSDEELQPRIISRKQKKERKQRIITSLSSTTTTEELAYPIQYYFNPELYLNFLNQCYLPNDNNNICKKWNDGIKKSDAIRLIPLAEELNLEEIEIGFVRKIIDSYRILQANYCENMNEYYKSFVKLRSVLDLGNIDKPNFEPTTNIIDDKFIELLCKYKEPFKRGMKLIKQNIIDVSNNMRKMYVLYGMVYDEYKRNYNEEEEKEEILEKLDLGDLYENIDGKLKEIIDLKKIFPKAGFTQDGGGKFDDIMKQVKELLNFKAPPKPLTDEEYNSLGLSLDGTKSITLTKPEHTELDFNKFTKDFNIMTADKLYNYDYVSTYENLTNFTLSDIIDDIINKIKTEHIPWVVKNSSKPKHGGDKDTFVNDATNFMNIDNIIDNIHKWGAQIKGINKEYSQFKTILKEAIQKFSDHRIFIEDINLVSNGSKDENIRINMNNNNFGFDMIKKFCLKIIELHDQKQPKTDYIGVSIKRALVVDDTIIPIKRFVHSMLMLVSKILNPQS
uniref:Uncharacterized protein n=1 Tax=viral metagenome TaxID=1070528 RepID=A0A6C0DZ86_9ZZZZ